MVQQLFVLVARLHASEEQLVPCEYSFLPFPSSFTQQCLQLYVHALKTVSIHGVEQPGQSVIGSTHLMHEKQDKYPSLARQKPQSSTGSSTKKTTASNSPTGKC